MLAPLGDDVPIVPAELEGDGYEYIDNLSTRPALGNIVLDWQFGTTGMKLSMAETDETPLYAGPAPGNRAPAGRSSLERLAFPARRAGYP